MKKLLVLVPLIVLSALFAFAQSQKVQASPAPDSIDLVTISQKDLTCGTQNVTVEGTATYESESFRRLKVKVDDVLELNATDQPDPWTATGSPFSLGVGSHTVYTKISDSSGVTEAEDTWNFTINECPEATPTPQGNGFGLPGDGLSDGRSDGHSSCPDCTKAPSGQVLGATTDFAGTGVADEIIMNAVGMIGGISTAAGLVISAKKKFIK